MKQFLLRCALLCLPLSLFPQSYPVSKIVFSAAQEELAEKLEQIEILLCEEDGILYAADESVDTTKQIAMTVGSINKAGSTLQFSQSALKLLVQKIYNYFLAHEIHWAAVYIANDTISPNGDDLRASNDTTLTVSVSAPVAAAVSVKCVDANDPTKEIERPKLNKKICRNTPTSLPDPSTGYPGGFINSNTLNNYLYALNRHPNRRVDLEIGPTGMPGEATLNFVVTEQRPFHFYFNANNNVPKPIDRWQESAGIIHTQLSGNDDILQINASTDTLDKYFSVNASYEAPVGDSIGTRWQIAGGFSRFLSAEFALAGNLFDGIQLFFNGEVVTNVAQWGRWFLDLTFDLQYRHIHNEGHAIFSAVTKNFLLPGAGVKVLQLSRETKFIGSVSVQSTMSSLFWDVKKDLDALGRPDLSVNWAILQAGVYGSFYLEPVFQKPDQVKRLANEIVVLGQMQNAFNQRLIPQLQGILGGLYTIRGYPQSTVAGDDLYMGSFEYRFHLPQLFSPNPNACTKLFRKRFRWAPAQPKGTTDWDFVLRAFYEMGTTIINQRQPFESNELLMGTGLGVEIVLWQNVFIRGDWGRALNSANGIASGNDEFYFSSTVIF